MSVSLRFPILCALSCTLVLGACNTSPAPSATVNQSGPGSDSSRPPVGSDPSLPALGIDSSLEARRTPDAQLKAAFDNNTSNLQVLVRGVVDRHLADDLEGDKHQRFIVRLSSGQTLLVAHNIDLATRVPASSVGKVVYLYGEYEWNAQGGVVHWTHRDPDGRHEHGWIQFEGVRYE